MRSFSGGALLTYPRDVQDDALAVAAKTARAAHNRWIRTGVRCT